MKSEIVVQKDNVSKYRKYRKYPWLGIGCVGDELWEKVVLFTEPKTGVVVNAGGKHVTLGEYYNDWIEEEFTDF